MISTFCTHHLLKKETMPQTLAASYVNKFGGVYWCCVFLLFIAVQCRAQEEGNGDSFQFILKGEVEMNDKPAEGVTLTLKRDDIEIKKIITPKSGKFSLEIHQVIADSVSEYLLYITGDGLLPKIMSVNTSVPPKEYQQYPFKHFTYTLQVNVTPLGPKDIVLKRPFGRIKWSSKDAEFTMDQEYALIVQKEVETIKKDPDAFAKEEEKRKQEEAEKKKNEEELAARIKQQQEAEKLLAQQEADRKREEESKVREEEIKKKEADLLITPPIQNPVAEKHVVAAIKTKTAVTTPVKIQNSAPAAVSDPAAFTPPIISYSSVREQRTLRSAQIKGEKTKSANLAAKYETNNVLTSMIDGVTVYEKKQKKLATP
jgi:hypothetical protein